MRRDASVASQTSSAIGQVKITNNDVQAWPDLPSTISANGSLLTLTNNTYTKASPGPPSGLYVDNGSNAAANTARRRDGCDACRPPA